MRILRVISSMNPEQGGPCQGIRNSIPELQKQGVENEVVCMDDENSEYLKQDNFKIHAIGASRGPWAYSDNLAPWLLKNLHEYDTVIIHGLWLYHSFAGFRTIEKFRKLNKAHKLNVYLMPHGMLDPWFQKAEGRKLKAIRNWFYWKLIEKKLVNGVDGVLFTSEQELLLARQTFTPYQPKKELNVGYGILPPPDNTMKMDISFRKQHSLESNTPYLLFLSRIHVKKGVELLIKGYTELQNGGIDLPLLVIAGPGLDTSYGQEMKSLAESNAKIRFTGMISGKDKWGAIYGCDAFILPSHQENFGIAVVEALACGKPVLISDQINIYDEIQNAGAGIIAKDTVQGVMELLISWNSLNSAARTKMAESATDTYKNKYSIEKAAGKLKELIE